MRSLFILMLAVSLPAVAGSPEVQRVSPEAAPEAPPDTKPQEAEPFTFRGLPWGATHAQVQKALPRAKPAKKSDGLIVVDQVAGIDSVLQFTFLGGGLAEISVSFMAEHSNPNDLVFDFEKVKGLLLKKYGTPEVDRQRWNGSLYKDDYERRGQAVLTGQLTYRAVWKLKDTTISTMLTGDNFKSHHFVLYESKASEAERKAQEEQKRLDEL